MKVGETVSYQLPQTYDPDDNSNPIAYLDYTSGKEDSYPPFLTYRNATNTLTMSPDTIWFRGRTYYFTVVVKEYQSDTVMTVYTVTVQVEGEPTVDVVFDIRDFSQLNQL